MNFSRHPERNPAASSLMLRTMPVASPGYSVKAWMAGGNDCIGVPSIRIRHTPGEDRPHAEYEFILSSHGLTLSTWRRWREIEHFAANLKMPSAHGFFQQHKPKAPEFPNEDPLQKLFRKLADADLEPEHLDGRREKLQGYFRALLPLATEHISRFLQPEPPKPSHKPSHKSSKPIEANAFFSPKTMSPAERNASSAQRPSPGDTRKLMFSPASDDKLCSSISPPSPLDQWATEMQATRTLSPTLPISPQMSHFPFSPCNTGVWHRGITPTVLSQRGEACLTMSHATDSFPYGTYGTLPPLCVYMKSSQT